MNEFKEARERLRLEDEVDRVTFPLDHDLSVACRSLVDTIEEFELARKQRVVADLRGDAMDDHGAYVAQRQDEYEFANRELAKHLHRVIGVMEEPTE